MTIKLNKTVKTKRALSLIELLIVLFLIAAALGSSALYFNKALSGERFERGVDQVIGKLTLAQELMLDFHSDIWVTFNHEGGKVSCHILSPYTALPISVERVINRNTLIEGVEKITFDHTFTTLLELHCDATLGATPQGYLTLSSQDREATLFLKGYPAKITRGKDEKQKNLQATYPEEALPFI